MLDSGERRPSDQGLCLWIPVTFPP